jgi:hypothetical protein
VPWPDWSNSSNKDKEASSKVADILFTAVGMEAGIPRKCNNNNRILVVGFYQKKNGGFL